MQQISKQNIKILTTTAILVAVSVAISYIEIPIIPAFPFLKLDFCKVPLILCAMIFGPGVGVLAEGVHMLLAYLMTGSASGGVGTALNFVLGVIFILSFCGIHKVLKIKFSRSVALAIGALITIIAATILNYVAVVPLYKLIGMVPESFDAALFTFGGALPLNLVKWPVNALLAGIVYEGASKTVLK